MPAARQRQRADFSNDVMTPFQIGSLMLQVGFPVSALPTGIAIALAESGGRRTATNTNRNGSIDRGLWQINSVHANEFPAYWGQWSNAVANTAMAKAIYDQSGWSPWVAFTSGTYSRYAVRANQGARNAVKGPSMEAGLQETSLLPVDLGVGATADALQNPIDSIGEFFKWLTDPFLWLRVASVIGGVLLLIIGGYMLFKEAALSEVVGIVAKKLPGLGKVPSNG